MTAVVVLVALRLAVGWHFFKEGADKRQDPAFTSAHFFRQAKGPLAPMFRDMIADRDGRKRLDLEGMLQTWQDYRDRVAGHFAFNAEQNERAGGVYERFKAQFSWYLAENGEEIDQYFLERERLREAEEEPSISRVAFQRNWIAGKRRELDAQLSGWMGPLDELRDRYQQQLHALATDEQGSRGGPRLADPGAMSVDTIVAYLHVCVGACLMLGLFTRTASVAGALFMLSVVAAQPPWVAGAQPMYKESVEMLALLALATTGAGRFAGLDYVIGGMLAGCCRGSKQGIQR